MTLCELTIRGRYVALPASIAGSITGSEKPQLGSGGVSLVPAAIQIANGRIVGITNYSDVAVGGEIEDAPDHTIVMPGTIDTHVHVNEPGRTNWEGFATATEAA